MYKDRVLMEGKVGIALVKDGAEQTLRLTKEAAIAVQQVHGKYAEAALRGKCFFAASQAVTTWSIALSTTHTGFVVLNPAGSLVNLAILQAGFALSVAPVAIAHIGLFGGFAAAGITVHTTALVPYSTILGGPAGYAKADAAATLVGTPVWIMPMQGGFTAGALPGTGMIAFDVDGSIIVPPGGYCGIGALTAALGFAGMVWEEIPI